MERGRWRIGVHAIANYNRLSKVAVLSLAPMQRYAFYYHDARTRACQERISITMVTATSTSIVIIHVTTIVIIISSGSIIVWFDRVNRALPRTTCYYIMLYHVI